MAIFTGAPVCISGVERGLSAVPPIAPEIRDGVRARLERDGVEALHAELMQRDPPSAERLKPRDRTASARAGSDERTGRSLTDWHRMDCRRCAGGQLQRAVSEPDRDALYARIDARFGQC